MRRKHVILILSILSFCLGFPQSSSLPVAGGNGINDRSGFNTNQKMLNLISSLDGIKQSSVYENIAISDIEGSMYYEPDFTNGIVFFDKEKSGVFQLRYNALNDEFEVKPGDGSAEEQAVIKRANVSCKLGNEHFFFKEYRSKNGDFRSGYLIELISKGKYKLYEKRVKVFKEGSDAKTSFHKSTPHRFLDRTDFFISKAENAPVYFKTSKKEILSLLDKDDAQRIKQFLKDKRGLDLNEKRELISVIAFANGQ